MKITSFTGGFVQTNGYLVETPDGNFLVDAPLGIAAWTASKGVRVDDVLLTHQHYDHVEDAAALREAGGETPRLRALLHRTHAGSRRPRVGAADQGGSLSDRFVAGCDPAHETRWFGNLRRPCSRPCDGWRGVPCREGRRRIFRRHLVFQLHRPHRSAGWKHAAVVGGHRPPPAHASAGDARSIRSRTGDDDRPRVAGESVSGMSGRPSSIPRGVLADDHLR